MRFVEIVLFLAPFVLFAVWRLMTPLGGGLSPRVIAASAALVVLLLAALLWLHGEGSLPPGTAYVPAQLEGGHVVPPRGVPQ